MHTDRSNEDKSVEKNQQETTRTYRNVTREEYREKNAIGETKCTQGKHTVIHVKIKREIRRQNSVRNVN